MSSNGGRIFIEPALLSAIGGQSLRKYWIAIASFFVHFGCNASFADPAEPCLFATELADIGVALAEQVGTADRYFMYRS
jgi:hypothetical protein